jgi:site-specific DNA recombinase
MKSAPSSARAPERRCAIYTRKSTAAGLEREFNSLEAQREACAEYVRRQPGWVLLDKLYDDGGYTGANTERPAFQRLLADVDAGRIDIILVYKVDRLSRSLLDFAQMMARFGDAGVSFVSVTQNFSTADPIGRLTLHVLMSFAEFERDMIAERTRDKIAGARRHGKWTGGQVPLGYCVIDGKLVVNELEAVVVQEIFTLYLEHRAILEVVRVLNERHRETKRYCTESGRVREGHAWTKPDVQRILHNPLYAGYMRAGRERCDGEHTALISRELFARVEAALAAATPERRGPPTNQGYLLRDLLRCGRCGATFTPASTTTKSGVVYRYYRCVTRDKQGKRGCHSKPLPAEAIETYVIDHLRQVIGESDGALVAEVTAAVQARIAERRAAVRVEHATLPPQIAALREEAQRVIELAGTTDGAAHRLLQDQLHKLSEQLAWREAELGAVERALAQLEDLEVEASWIDRCLRELDRIWDILSPANRVRLVRAVIERVEIDEPAGNVTLTFVDLGKQIPMIEEQEAATEQLRPGAAP